MICIVVATTHEAKPLINFFGLKKSPESGKFRIYQNYYLKLIVSGVGALKSAIATAYIINQTVDIHSIVNLGVCGSADSNIKLGTAVLINKITNSNTGRSFYPEMLVNHDFIEASIGSYDNVVDLNSQSSVTTKLVDMESYGFFEAASKFLMLENIYCIKIPIDFLQPEYIKISYIQNQIDKNIFALSNFLKKIFVYNNTDILTQSELDRVNQLSHRLYFSESMRNQLINLSKYFKLINNNLDFLKELDNVTIDSKNEGKILLEGIRNKIVFT